MQHYSESFNSDTEWSRNNFLSSVSDTDLESELTRTQRESLQKTHFSNAIGRTYSDILTQTIPNNVVRTLSVASKIFTEKHVPPAKSFEGPGTVEDVFGKKEDSFIFDSDFPASSYEPKVQLQYIVPPEQLPRKVHIERLRKLYAVQDIGEILASRNVNSYELIPSLEHSNIEKGLHFSSFLPPELFDDSDLDPRTTTEWLSLAITQHGIRKALPGKAFIPAKETKSSGIFSFLNHEWLDVGVLDYNPETNLWLVQTVNEYGRILDRDEIPFWPKGLDRIVVPMTRPNIYWIPRLRLRFLAENANSFAARVEKAIASRDYAENLIRYWLYLDLMPTEGMNSLDKNAEERIVQWAISTHSFKRWPGVHKFLPQYRKELRHAFQMCMNQLLLNHMLKINPDLKGLVQPPSTPTHVIPYQEVTDLPKYSMQQVKRKFIFRSFLIFKEAAWALSKVRTECNKPMEMTLFLTNSPKSVRLDEFEQVQSQVTQQVHLFLKDSWGSNIVIAIRGYVQYVGKGWFDIKGTDWEIYNMSKLKRFMIVVRFMMQDSLRYLVLESLQAYTQMIVDACYQVEGIDSHFMWGSDLKTSKISPKRNPLFNIDLLFETTGVHYTNELESFEQIVLALFNKGISATHTVKEVERYVMTEIYWYESPYLESVGLMEPQVVRLRQQIIRLVKQSLIPLRAYAAEYEKYLPLIQQEVPDFVRALEVERQEEVDIHDIKQQIDLLNLEKKAIEQSVPPSIVIGPFNVNTENAKQILIKKTKAVSVGLLDEIAKRLSLIVQQIADEYNKISRRIFEKPSSIEEIHETREWIKTIPARITELVERCDSVVIDYDILDKYFYVLPSEDFIDKFKIINFPNRLEDQVVVALDNLVQEEDKFLKLLMQDQGNLKDKLDNLTGTIAGLQGYVDIGRAHELANDIRRIAKHLKECQEQAATYNRRETIAGLPLTNYSIIPMMTKTFEPYRNLWLTISDWLKWHESWMNDPLMSIDAEALERNVTESYKTMHRLLKSFTDFPNLLNVVQDVKKSIEEFKPNVPLIQALRNPGMRSRHWDQLSDQLGFRVVAKANLTFNKCLDMGLSDHIDLIANVGDIASKEYAIEQALEKMESQWKGCMMDVSPYKDTGTSIIKVGEEVTQMLDDHIVLTQSMSFSPFKKPFEDRINTWENKLRISQDVLDEWLTCQRAWLYLEPIFSSEDITRQLPLESKRYQTMERHWRRILKGASLNPEIINLCSDPMLLETLRECNKLLDQVQKGLSEYLETKRAAFPRFYFLSDDELLEILSQTKDPTAVQPHLRKCFENIAKLTFQPDLEITAMCSAEGELVTFSETMYPAGNVEDWLARVEAIMMLSLREILKESIAEYPQMERTDFVVSWPGQVVIATCQVYWTFEVEQALNEKILPDFYLIQLRQLDNLRVLVRGELTRSERQILSALIVIEVHARDVVSKMVEEDIQNPNDFEWISQLRYYWVEDNLFVRAVNAEFHYGYEYLGNTGRLVITPLTDRCYLTLTGALHLKFGGAPAGPAGTGKTETTKDLAKAMAIQCVVFNCSDQLDFIAMGKFFKGLASSGAWACFDEFNRIDIEVLSVVAQQITTIQKALIAAVDVFTFEGSEIGLRLSCAIFITMNPGYAGRTELPDNLKALFRPVAMMVPDYTLIAEISLFSFGFSNAKVLAVKITSTFKLSSEQLSSQDHYDFGMRAVKTVIAAAGNLKRERPSMNEELIALRAIRDVNVPKFLQDDLKLFDGIVSDLFPKVQDEPIDYGELERSLKESCHAMGLKDVPAFLVKCIQLYETTVVRHGLMLVGPTGSGKTRCYEVLMKAINALKGKASPSGALFNHVHSFVLNPKSITMGQLYGEFDMLTHEWTDGILSSLVRGGSAVMDDDKRWYMFDGPVDAVWIENMNSVLDDNKKLCLSSGEIIKLSDNQTLMFEVMDLAVASPATVSRCGMVYMEPSVLGLEPFVTCWLLHRIPKQGVPYVDQLRPLFEAYLEPSIDFVRSNLKEIVETVNSNLTFSLLKLLESFLKDFPLPTAVSEWDAARAVQITILVECYFIFSIIWTIGATCDNEGRRKFSEWFQVKMNLEDMKLPIPEEGLVYDYCIDSASVFNAPGTEDEEELPVVKWVSWMSGVPAYNITASMKYADIIVPTMDTIRNAFIVQALLTNSKTVLCVGPTGTGKSVTIIDILTKNLPSEYVCDLINFSARTSANQVQDLIDNKLDKRRKGVFGPPPGRSFVFFIDDMNMPALETYGAQPPIELLRQWMDFGGWYDRRAIGEFRTLIDVNFICAMGPPGGGRNQVTPRFLRHFNFLSYTELEDSSKYGIFHTILMSWLGKNIDLQDYGSQLVLSSIDVYNTITSQLLPTPTKSHYTFNLRDLSKVFQGMLMGSPTKIIDLEDLLLLWYHEGCRVYQDRLVSSEDRKWFDELIDDKFKQDFDCIFDEMMSSEPLIYADFLSQVVEPKEYEIVKDMVKLEAALNEGLEDYNQTTTAQMKLVLFMDAIQHVCRISRVLRQPGGNALLLGVGGSGRQSLTRLSAHMNDMECSQIELAKNYGVSEWKDDLKNIMLKSGLKNRNLVFLFSDTQIKDEVFLEDLNNILNTGDVPNLFAIDDLEKIYRGMRSAVQEAGLPATKANLYSMLTKQVRSNLHVVVAMSPIGEIFRARLRQFPALVNCCTIDWFSQWPEAALKSVASNFLKDVPAFDADEAVTAGCVSICQVIHQSVMDASERFKQELSRYNYVTPKSYLDLMITFGDLLTMKKDELVQARNRMSTGLDKLLSTAEFIANLQLELEVLRPQLIIAGEETVATMAQIAQDTKVAEKTKMLVLKEEDVATRKAQASKAIADDAERDLNEALPALDAAVASLKNLNKGDIVEVRAMQHPPDGVRLVMETICIMKNMKPKMVAGDKPGQKVADYWESGKPLLQDPAKFIDSLFKYDKENIPEETIKKIIPYMADPNFTPEAVSKVSKACTSLCLWVGAMYKYHNVVKIVAPKKEALAEANAELEETKKILDEAKARLTDVEDGLAKLNDNLAATIRKKQELEANSRLCEARLIRADKLISGLKDERHRWEASVQIFNEMLGCVIGDVLVSAGFIAYLGPFTDEYRRSLGFEWMRLIGEYKVPHSDDPNLVAAFGDPVLIRNWQIAGLPKDILSTENAVIVHFSQRWPLFIDPQGQANKWIKSREKEQGVIVFKISDKDFLRHLETAIRFGNPALMENVGEELDPSLEPILLKQTYKQGGSVMIKLGDNVVPYHENFRLYITTALPNPHYTPEVSTKVTVVNFTLAPSGLEDQLLACVVAEERPDLEEAKNQLIVSNAEMKSDLKELEDQILYRLSASEGNPVDDEEFIEILEASKLKSAEIKAKVIVAEQTEKDIDVTRSQYIPVAVRAQILFFCMCDLAAIDSMYQYSLDWFLSIFINSIRNAEETNILVERMTNINNHFTFNLYTSVCRSLFEKHKLLFAFLLTVRIKMNDKEIDPIEWRYLLAGGQPKISRIQNPDPSWISDRSWKEILSLAALTAFGDFLFSLQRELKGFKKIFDSLEPHRQSLPGAWQKRLSQFQRILVLRAIRPDKVTNAMQDYVASSLGQRFIEPQATDLADVFRDSSSTVPLLFILSQGTDPAAELNKFAEKMKFSKKLTSISLGQGQGPRAELLMKNAMESGQWVFFQNCHLSPSWMPSLEKLVETIDSDKVHRDFRLWLTSMPSPKFPGSILQNGSKMTVEPPRGIKANLLRVYLGLSDDYFNSCSNRVSEFKHLMLSLSLFHSCTVERKKFGPLGFNIPYEFTDGDLQICISQLLMFLMEYEEIAFKVLRYTAGQINFGGRVTDDWDRRTIMNILNDFYNPDSLNSQYSYDEDGVYHQLNPDETTHAMYLEYIRSLPINDSPQIFGLHDNANITFAQNELFILLNNLLSLQPKTTAAVGGKSREEVLQESAKNILERIPPPFEIDSVIELFPIVYEESMNTVLVQELLRYNKLLAIIQQSLKDLLKALVGLMVMSQELEALSNSLFNNSVPVMWQGRAYPSLKPLASWVTDLEARMAFFSNWISFGTPDVFWISGLFFPQAFLTGTLQNFARKNKLPIDTVSFDFEVIDTPKEELVRPADGCYIWGLFLEGARWDPKVRFLRESHPKELFTEMPQFWLKPVEHRISQIIGVYLCPVYKTLTRAGTLSTTGHSTNYVLAMEIPSDRTSRHWIKRGVAMICALDY